MDSSLKTPYNTRAHAGKGMNKNESGAVRFVTERRQRSFVPFLSLQMHVSADTCSTLTAHALQQSLHADGGPVGKRLTLISRSVNASVAHPLDGLLLGDVQRLKQRN